MGRLFASCGELQDVLDRAGGRVIRTTIENSLSVAVRCMALRRADLHGSL